MAKLTSFNTVYTLQKDVTQAAVATDYFEDTLPDTRYDIKVIQGVIVGSGAISGTIEVLGSLDGIHWVGIEFIELNGTDNATNAVVINEPWAYIKSSVLSTNATITVLLGV